MKKIPFSNAGFQALQKELYALSDANLQVVSNAVFNHFNDWMSENFELSPSQIGFIENLNPKMTNLLAGQTAMALINRLPINLIKPDNQMNTLLRGSKLIRPDAKVSASSQGEDGFEIEGSLDIEITY